MVQHQYPVFVEGQTLTRDDLNVLRDHLRDRDRSIGRLVGFGVACGLTGEVREDGLHVDPGLAVDQTGEPLVLPAAQRLPLPPVPDADTFDFVTGTDGFTVVLVATDVAEPDTGCDEIGCDTHAELHTTGVALLVVTGRLARPGLDFASEPLLGQTPLRVTRNSSVAGDLDTLRDALLDRIGDRLDAELRDKLARIAITATDLPAIAAYKAAFVNEVLFAALDLLRFEALLALSCLRTAAPPGVALGWLHPVGAGWAWDCTGGQAWEPPTGLTLAVLGGSCQEPARPYLDRLVALVDGFSLPPVPAPADPPKDPPGGGFPICRPLHKKPWLYRDCPIRVFPEEVIPDRWRDVWIEERFPPDPGYVDPRPPWEVYEIDEPDLFDAGLIDLLPAFGAEVDGVRGLLEDAIGGAGVAADVRVLTAAEADALDGYAPTGAVSPSDSVVLVRDDVGKVVATGRVAAARSLRQVGTALPEATRAAAEAVGATGALRTDLDATNVRVDSVSGEVGDLRGHVDTELGGIDDRIGTLVASEVARAQTELAGALPGMVGAVAETVRVGLVDQLRAEVDVAVGERVQELRGELDPRVREVVERASALDSSVGAYTEQLRQTTGRIDDLYRSGGVGVRGVVGSEDAANGLVSVLDAMRRSVEAAAPDERRQRVRAELDRADEAGRVVRDAVRGAAMGREGLSRVLDAMAGAVRASGAPEDAVRQLEREIESLKGALER